MPEAVHVRNAACGYVKRPNAFFVPISDDEAHLADPDAILTTGCYVVVRIGDGYLPGLLATRDPKRSKTLAVRVGSKGGILRRIEKPNVVRVVSISRSRLNPNV